VEAQADALMLQATVKAQPEPVDVYQLLEKLVDQFSHRAGETRNEVHLFARPDSHCKVLAIAPYLRSAFINLLDNAVKYSIYNEKIPVKVTHISKRYLQIEITNTGIESKASAKSKQGSNTFALKYAIRQVEEDSKRQRPGQGIGLSQTIKLIEDHSGAFDIKGEKTNRGTGDGRAIFQTRATVILPLL